MPKDGTQKTAELHRMVMPDHLCPFGLKSKDLLERQGYKVEDHHLTTRAESVFKAVYVDKRELKCACVGGDSSVPLGFVSLTENLMMMAMGIWMPLKAIVF